LPGTELSLRVVGVSSDVRSGSVDLTDGSDDFDFVTADDDSLLFTALDGTERTDTWLNNSAELGYEPDPRERESHDRDRLDPWDPDTDNDGLTDGQEAEHLIHQVSTIAPSANEIAGEEIGTSPLDPDSDQDGWWDGWVGVRDVGRSDDVILYRNHLESGSGVEGDETVPQQKGIHDVTFQGRSIVPHGVAGDIDDDGELEHSNQYLGELRWGTSPTQTGDTPDTSYTVEVDYWNGANTLYALLESQSREWLNTMEANFRLYGIKMTFIKDEIHSDFDHLWYVDADSGVTAQEIREIEASEGDDYDTDEYLFVANRPDPDGLSIPTGATGFNLYDASFLTEGMSISC
jgi:hypothetical protein